MYHMPFLINHHKVPPEQLYKVLYSASVSQEVQGTFQLQLNLIAFILSH